jgi:DNA-binding IclR family transcriptional regulator
MSKIVERTLDCFELFADQKQPLSLTEISRLLSIPPSSCHDVLRALQMRGYIYELTPRGGFYPTLRLYDLAKTIADNDPVLVRAELLLKSLRDLIDESVTLAKVSGLQATYLLNFESSQQLRISVKVGMSLRSVHATAAGKALLASLDERALGEYLKSTELKPLTTHTVTSKAELRKQIETGREKGYFHNREESIEGVSTLAAPFRWLDSLYIVSVAGPTARIEPKLEWAAQLIKDVCRRLEMRAEPGAPRT